MTLIEGLVAFLKATPAITALCGSNVFPQEAAQGTGTPRLVLKRTSETDDYTLQGFSRQPTAHVTACCFGGKLGKGYTSARQLADAVKVADGGLGGRQLAAYIGMLGSVVCQSCRFDDDADESDPDVEASGRAQQSVNVNFVIAYIEQ